MADKTLKITEEQIVDLMNSRDKIQDLVFEIRKLCKNKDEDTNDLEFGIGLGGILHCIDNHLTTTLEVLSEITG